MSSDRQSPASDGPIDRASAMERVYLELRAIAARYLQAEPRGATLQPTMIVHEAFVRLAQQDRDQYNDEAHFRAIACTTMRRVLLDHARTRAAARHGGGMTRVTLTDDLVASRGERDVPLLDLDDALTRLGAFDERAARLVELRYFGGLSVEAAAGLLGISKRTAEDDWALARAWLARETAECDAPTFEP